MGGLCQSYSMFIYYELTNNGINRTSMGCALEDHYPDRYNS